MLNTSFAFRLLLLVGLLAGVSGSLLADDPWVVLDGQAGPGMGKHIVLVTGDEEYRSEESMPQLAKILATHHGFKCTVLFGVNRQSGEIDPQTLDNIPGLEALKTADLMIIFTRFRELPDGQMQQIMDYVNSGRPILGLRTSTHAFNYRTPSSPFAKYSFRSQDPAGGFGRQVLGETWVNHYGKHQVESTRGIVAPGQEQNPIVRGCEDIWGPSDVYGLTTLEGDCTPVVLGQILVGMSPTDQPKPEMKTLPVAWTKTFTGASGKPARVFTTTMGHGGDLQSEGFRRLLVNACYWCLGMEGQIPQRAKVDLIGKYEPNPIGVGQHKRGIKPADHRLN